MDGIVLTQKYHRSKRVISNAWPDNESPRSGGCDVSTFHRGYILKEPRYKPPGQ